ncbi:DUF418 domain-containing protein [Sphingomonas sp. So64.6b]|uniref:DUF418 domain-containing protein n=1 Tax=Sphingomonas sp. So64.6b TaxID=2997354 RepID=UPI0015FF8EE0|nr:DUF418 domain-containing protein [Sphingomonas sp. So64.6b]QNA84025.1 DUF418 domain-containing protein [Sphingomonas sp. So64.6b]
MSDGAMTTAVEPDGAPRVAGLDILRGIAILGILFMNINDMGGSLWASFDDIRHLGWTQADQVAWWLREIFADGTARCMLEMLFGVGMVILTDRAASALETSATDPASRIRRIGRALFGEAAVLRGYYWRNFVLFLFGLVHIFILLWPGDILHTYGIAAMVAFLFRRCGPKVLLGIGLTLAMLQLIGGGIGLTMAQQARSEVAQLRAKRDAGQKLTATEIGKVKDQAERADKRAKKKAEDATRIAAEDKARSDATGTSMSWAKAAWTTIFFLWGFSDGIGDAMFLEWAFVWEAAGTMLIGAALFKWGIIQGNRSRSFYQRATLIAYAIGLTGRAVAAYWETQFDDYPHMILATGEVTRLATTIGHIGLVYVLLGTVAGTKLLKPFEAAGRTALTLYILQTIICLWILYPPFALGLYGQQGWMGLMLTALAVNALLLWAANRYLRDYAIAPVEWAWRSIISGRILPLRRGGRTATGTRPVVA